MLKKTIIFAIRLYQRHISPIKSSSGVCRFYPTCSQYAIGAVEKYGAILGTILATARILRCNPLCRGGIDPVPEHFTLKPFAYGRSIDEK